MSKMYFEDYVVGSEHPLGSYTVTEEEIISFARQYDPQPFTSTRPRREQSIYGGLISSGWMTCGIIMRLLVLSMGDRSTSMGRPAWMKSAGSSRSMPVTP
jgi:acyl dehydratase